MLVGIVVVLLALVGAAVFGLIDGVAPPDAEFEVETEGQTSWSSRPVPNQFRPKSCTSAARTRTDEAVQFGAWPGDGVVQPGDRVTVPNATGNENLEVVWEPVAFDTYETLGTYNGEDSAIEGSSGRDPLGATGV